MTMTCPQSREHVHPANNPVVGIADHSIEVMEHDRPMPSESAIIEPVDDFQIEVGSRSPPPSWPVG